MAANPGLRRGISRPNSSHTREIKREREKKYAFAYWRGGGATGETTKSSSLVRGRNHQRRAAANGAGKGQWLQSLQRLTEASY